MCASCVELVTFDQMRQRYPQLEQHRIAPSGGAFCRAERLKGGGAAGTYAMPRPMAPTGEKHFFGFYLTQGVIVMRFKEEGDQVISLALTDREETAGTQETEEGDPHASRLFDHLTGRAQRLLSATEQEKEYALQLREMHQTQLDMRQNQIMKILTIVTTVFLPLSLIAGWYGMNFVNMPELTARHGYLAVCIVSAVCILVELVIFKWKKWL